MKILVLNSGSSSLKYKLYEVAADRGDMRAVAAGGAERIGIEGSFVQHKKDGRETDALLARQCTADIPCGGRTSGTG